MIDLPNFPISAVKFYHNNKKQCNVITIEFLEQEMTLSLRFRGIGDANFEPNKEVGKIIRKNLKKIEIGKTIKIKSSEGEKIEIRYSCDKDISVVFERDTNCIFCNEFCKCF